MSRCVLYAIVIFFVFTGIAACNQAKSLVSEVISPFHGFFITFFVAATSNVESSNLNQKAEHLILGRFDPPFIPYTETVL